MKTDIRWLMALATMALLPVSCGNDDDDDHADGGSGGTSGSGGTPESGGGKGGTGGGQGGTAGSGGASGSDVATGGQGGDAGAMPGGAAGMGGIGGAPAWAENCRTYCEKACPAGGAGGAGGAGPMNDPDTCTQSCTGVHIPGQCDAEYTALTECFGAQPEDQYACEMGIFPIPPSGACDNESQTYLMCLPG